MRMFLTQNFGKDRIRIFAVLMNEVRQNFIGVIVLGEGVKGFIFHLLYLRPFVWFLCRFYQFAP